MMTFVEATATAGRKTGEIKLHGPDGFAGMRRAGRLTAEALDRGVFQLANWTSAFVWATWTLGAGTLGVGWLAR
jgi:hypothetical protein